MPSGCKAASILWLEEQFLVEQNPWLPLPTAVFLLDTLLISISLRPGVLQDWKSCIRFSLADPSPDVTGLDPTIALLLLDSL